MDVCGCVSAAGPTAARIAVLPTPTLAVAAFAKLLFILLEGRPDPEPLTPNLTLKVAAVSGECSNGRLGL